MEKISSYYKAITAFVVSFGLFLTGTLADPDVANALPDGWLKWLTVVGLPAIIGFGTLLKRNEPSVEEAETILRRAVARANGEKPLPK